ncbi:O-methyltransferase [Coralloluteibacterium thermophilus]|uniref:O-methyltransferase n=1 Tax=Coralloluteibacterium thermophilum TaxID=2707049 RepID=A0ABV9NI03_9GAMM
MPRPGRSTAKFIAYDLRPAKQSERGLLVDMLRIGGDVGLSLRNYRYVGMGANRFYDFLLIHKYLGLRNMVSLEYDEDMYERARYNAPYSFIDVRNMTVADFLASDSSREPEILWLDYDGGIGPDIVADINAIGSRLKVGDYCFMTVSGGPPRVMDQLSDADRLATLQDTMGDVSGNVTLEDVERSNFPDAVHKILSASFKNAFAMRTDGRFRPLLQVEYSDSMPMVTVGGALLADGTWHSYRQKMAQALPFLPAEWSTLYTIRSFYLTEKERALFDLVATSSRSRSREKNLLKKMGFKDKEFAAYAELIRYLPRYVETAV